MEIVLGSKVKDITDGFTGIATSRTTYLNGCVQYHVQPPVDPKTGASVDGARIDAECLKIMPGGIVKAHAALQVVRPLKAKATTGGPRRSEPKTKPR